MQNKIIIGVMGRAGSGKDTIAEMAQNYFAAKGLGVTIEKLAEPVYDAAYAITGSKTNKTDFKNQSFGSFTGRKLLIAIGDGLRGLLNSNIWVDILFDKIKKLSKQVVVISDIRYLNECDRVLDNGGYIIFTHRDSCDYIEEEDSVADAYDWISGQNNVLSIENNSSLEELLYNIVPLLESIYNDYERKILAQPK